MALTEFWKDVSKELGIKKIDVQQSYNRNLFFAHLTSGILKMEFTYFSFPRIEVGPAHYGIETESLIDIAVNKLFTIYQRTKARDYIDLLQLGTQFFKATDAPDLPRMILDIPATEWQGFFLEEARKLQMAILE